MPNIFCHSSLSTAYYHFGAVYSKLNYMYSQLDALRILCPLFFPICSDGIAQQVCQDSCLANIKLLPKEYTSICYALPTENCYNQSRINSSNVSEATVSTTSTILTTPTTIPHDIQKGVKMDDDGNLLGTLNSGISWLPFCRDYMYELNKEVVLSICSEAGYDLGDYLGMESHYDSGIYFYCPSSAVNYRTCTMYSTGYCYYKYIIKCYESSVNCTFTDGHNCGYIFDGPIPPQFSSNEVLLSTYSQVTSPTFQMPNGSLHFQYIASEPGAFSVFFKKNEDSVWQSRASSKWKCACIQLPDEESMNFNFVYNGNKLMLRRLTVMPGPCLAFPSVVCSFDCDGECIVDIGTQCLPNSGQLGDVFGHTKQYGWQYSNQNGSSHMFLDASYGNVGDVATMTIEMSDQAISSKETLRFSLKSLAGQSFAESDLTNSLSALLNVKLDDMIIFTSDRSYPTWSSVCISHNTSAIFRHLKFEVQHSGSLHADISVDNVRFESTPCPSPVDCTFDGNTCDYTFGNLNDQYSWQRVESCYGSFSPTDPKTQRTNSHMCIQNCRQGNPSEGTTSKMISPEITPSKDPTYLSFYLRMHGSSVGRFIVQFHSSSTRLDLFDILGSQGNQWNHLCVKLPADGGPGRLHFIAQAGNGCNGTIQIDMVALSAEKCSVPLVEKQCDFDTPWRCQEKTNCTDGSKFQWQDGQGFIPQTNILGSTFKLLDASYGVEGDESFMWFPPISTVKMSNPVLTFTTMIIGSEDGIPQANSDWSKSLLSVYVQTANKTQKLDMDLQGDYYMQLVRLTLPKLDNLQVVFRAVHGFGKDGDIILKNMTVEDILCSDWTPSVECTFDGCFASCGYLAHNRNPYFQFMEPSHTWSLVDADFLKNINIPLNSFHVTGNVLFAEPHLFHTSTTSEYVSPPISLSGPSCVSFFFMVHSLLQDVTETPTFSVMVKNENHVISGAILEIKSLQRSNVVQIPVNIEPNTMPHLVFSVAPFAFAIVDNITVRADSCPPIVCPPNFISCTTFCIEDKLRCNREVDCPNGEDELNCGGTIECDFEDVINQCLYRNYSNAENKHVFETVWYIENSHYQFTTGRRTRNNTWSHFLGFSRYQYYEESYELSSPLSNISSLTCAKFYYVGYFKQLNVTTHSNVENFGMFIDDIYMYRDVWMPGQVQLAPGINAILFNVSVEDKCFFGLDDVSFTNGPCGTLDCGEDGFLCQLTNICIPKENMCNGRKDCRDGSDEMNCVQNVSCSFEEQGGCGYDFGNSSWWIVEANKYSSPVMDRTYNTIGKGHFAYISSRGIYYSGTTVLNSPTGNLQGCLSFWYHILGDVAGILKVFVKSETFDPVTIFVDDGTSFVFDQWKYVQIPINYTNARLMFVSYDQEYFFGPGTVALDEIKLIPGVCNPIYNCEDFNFRCNDSGLCIPEQFYLDGIADCSDESDESVHDNATNAEVRLIGGLPGQGRIEIFDASDKTYKVMCNSLTSATARVICKQLGYSENVNVYIWDQGEFGNQLSSRYDSKTLLSCSGDEETINACELERTSCYYGYAQAVSCTDEVCFPGYRPCITPGQSTYANVHCVKVGDWCNSHIDCPNAEDENFCINCSLSSFECKNHNCINSTLTCNKANDCEDWSDELNCIEVENNQVSIKKNGNWHALCSNSVEEDVGQFVCSVANKGEMMGMHAADIYSSGLEVFIDGDINGIIPEYSLRENENCSLLEIQCKDEGCGLTAFEAPLANILYGSDAVPKEWPWQIALTRSGDLHCGGVLIASEWALTAYHCVESIYYNSDIELNMGSVEISNFEDDLNLQRRTILHLYHHPEARFSYQLLTYDVSLIRLSQPVIYTDYVRPICLAPPNRNLRDYHECFVSGWGKDEYENNPRDTLQKVEVDLIFDRENCAEKVIKFFGPLWSDEGICIENKNPYSPVCYGDSGGPLMCRMPRSERWELVGITSYGGGGCLNTKIPDVYSNIPHFFFDWIQQTTGMNFSQSLQ